MHDIRTESMLFVRMYRVMAEFEALLADLYSDRF
jgi:hypothetical protein